MDRDRPPSGSPATRIILLANIAIFGLQWLAGPRWLPVREAFALSRGGLETGAVWQLVTYQFLHANELHILVNMLGLWFAGRELERAVGTRKFVALYLGGGVFAGLVQMVFGTGEGPLIGASGSVCAVILALTTMFPSLEVMALLFFVLPLRMRARTLGILAVVASVIFWLSGLQPGVGHLAHLGGFAAGWVFGLANRRRLGDGGGFEWPRWPGGIASTRSVSHLRPVPSMDEIMAKVQREGIDRLTGEERRILAESRQRRRR